MWNQFCDWYIEFSKESQTLRPGKKPTCALLVLRQSLALLHPFAPFITEEPVSYLPEPAGAEARPLIVSDYPAPAISLSMLKQKN